MKRHGLSLILSFAAVILLVPAAFVAPCHAVTVGKGDRAPLFTSTTLQGEKFELKDHLGEKVVLLNFWSVFCRDCISRIEALNKINDLYQKREFELIGIAGDPPTDRMLSQVKKYAAKMHYQVILDPELEIFDSYGVEIIPFAVLVDRDGTVVMAIQSLEPEPIKAISDAIDRLTKE
ncbi:MAG: TlpA disulfide reductase family protein [bacterium]|nr:TlpA disulfide reductase family protein [bacterium]MDT8394815.1 TlpA disulfide reductase family protein [bacterium]